MFKAATVWLLACRTGGLPTHRLLQLAVQPMTIYLHAKHLLHTHTHMQSVRASRSALEQK